MLRASEIFNEFFNLIRRFFFGCFTLLFEAVENGHVEVVKLLLQHGANVEGPHSWSGWNSLHQAAFQVTWKCIIPFPCNWCILSGSLYIFCLFIRWFSFLTYPNSHVHIMYRRVYLIWYDMIWWNCDILMLGSSNYLTITNIASTYKLTDCICYKIFSEKEFHLVFPDPWVLRRVSSMEIY